MDLKSFIMRIPIIINNRDLLKWPKAMVEKIKTYENVGDIIIVDNGSTYEPLLDWYNSKPCDIIYYKNLGHTGAWLSGVVSNLASEYYVVTDPDLGLDDTPQDTLIYLYDKMNKLNLDKIGLGLEWKSVGKNSLYYNHLMGYEKKRWQNSRIQDNIYLDIAVDTTFALYRIKKSFGGGASTGYPYIAKHFPWYMTKEESENDKEFMFYINHASSSSSYKKILNPYTSQPVLNRVLNKLSVFFSHVSR